MFEDNLSRRMLGLIMITGRDLVKCDSVTAQTNNLAPNSGACLSLASFTESVVIVNQG